MIKNALGLIGLLLFVSQIGVAQEAYSPESLLDFEQRSVNILENKGQLKDFNGNSVDFVLFKIETKEVDFYLTETGATYVFKEFEEEHHEEGKGREEEREIKWERIDLILNNASVRKENIIREFPSTQGHFNYFHEHCLNGIYDVKEYGKITIKEVYPNIDWVLYNTKSTGYKYDFVLNPGANPDDIDLVYRSKNKPELSDDGELSIQTDIGTLTEKSPVSFLNEEKIDSRFELKSITSNKYGGYDSHFNFEFSDKVKQQVAKKNGQLVIDPELVWATCYGGASSDGTYSIDVDSENNIYAVGYTASLNFPTEDAGEFFQGTLGSVDIFDLFIVKFDNDGNRLWATYYGGTNFEEGLFVHVDIFDNLFVGGAGKEGCPTHDAGTFFQEFSGGEKDGLLLKFDSDGNRLWATYYGGYDDDWIYGLDTDADGNLFVTGATRSDDFPILDAGTYFQSTYGGGVEDCFILKFDNDGNRLWATYYGGGGALESGNAVAVDNTGNIFVVGETTSEDFPLLDAGTFYDDLMDGPSAGFILKFDNEGNHLWGTYCDGNQYDQVCSVVIDSSNDLVVAGLTSSADYPLLDAGGYFEDEVGAFDAFIMRFENDGELVWSSLYGGGFLEQFKTFDNLAVDPCNNIYLFFDTHSTGIYTTPFCDGGFYQDVYDGGGMQFLTQFNADNELIGATFIGGSDIDFRSAIACDTRGNVLLTGEWNFAGDVMSPTYELQDNGTYFDSTPNGFDDMFFMKLTSNYNLISELNVVGDSCGMETGSIEVILEEFSCSDYVEWSLGGEFIMSTDETILIESLAAGTYTLRVASNCDTVTLEDVNIPAIGEDWSVDLGNDSVICSTDFIFDPGIDAVTYEWQDGSSTPTYLVDEEGEYWLIATSEEGCVAVDSVIFTMGGLDVGIMISEPTCHGLSDGLIVLSIDDGTEETIYEIKNAEGAIINTENSNSVGELNAGWYHVYVDIGAYCAFIDSIFMDQPDPITTDINVTDPLCHGDSTGFAVAEVYAYQGDLENVSYVWTPNFFGGEGTGVDSAYGMPKGEYVLTLTDEMGCTDTIDFVMDQPEELELSELGNDPAFCRMFSYQNGNGIVYAAAIGGTPGYTYLWENSQTLETSNNSTWGGLNPGNYKITVTDNNGCVLIDYIRLDSVSPIAAFDVLSDQLDDNLEGTELVNVTFINQSEYFSNSNDLFSDTTFRWNLDHDYTDWEVSHDYFYQPDTTYAGEKIYEVCLIAYNKNSCRDTLCKEIIVHVQPEFVAPNIFTPGSDNSNDLFTFEFRTEGITEFHCVIVNRWGVTVAELTDITEGWDGTDQNGNPCTGGVYFYSYEAVSTNKTAFNGQGTVQLIANE